MCKRLHTLQDEKAYIRGILERKLGAFAALGTDALKIADVIIKGSSGDFTNQAGEPYGMGEEKDKGRKIFGSQDSSDDFNSGFANIFEGIGSAIGRFLALIKPAVQLILITLVIIIIHTFSPPLEN